MDDEITVLTEELVTGEWRAYPEGFEGAPEHSQDLGPEGEGMKFMVGIGKTEQAAVDDLLEQME